MTHHQDDVLADFIEQLTAETNRKVPTSGWGRMTRTARTALGTAVGAVKAHRRGAQGLSLGAVDVATLQKLVTALGELKGVPMKVGQILSYIDPTMPPEARQLLSLLQTRSQPSPLVLIQQTITEDLGPSSMEILKTMEHVPVSVASIGQVHRATLPDGTAVAVKVRHPGMDEALRSDFRLAGPGTSFAKVVMPGGGATAAEVAAEAQARMLEECDYRLEAARQHVFARLYANHARVVVPAVHLRWCGPRVLVTSWMEGRDFESYVTGPLTQEERSHTGEALFDFYIGTLYREALFHADPHPGNYCFMQDGHMVVFDYGCVREFDRPTVLALVELMEAMRSNSDAAIRDALAQMGAMPPRDSQAFAHIRSLLQAYFRPMLQSGAHVIDAHVNFDLASTTRNKIALARLRLPGKLLFLFRIRFGLYAVLARLGARLDWSALEERFAHEARQRAKDGA